MILSHMIFTVISCIFSVHLTVAIFSGHYKVNDPIPVHVSNVAPFHNPTEKYPYDLLPWPCKPKDIHSNYLNLFNLGAIINGERNRESLYHIYFQRSTNKERMSSVCGDKELSASNVNSFIDAINNEYQYEMWVDDLPVFGRIGFIETNTTIDTKQYFLFTHRHFHIEYNNDEVITVNVSSVLKPGYYVQIEKDTSLKQIHFTYSVLWSSTTIPYSDRWKKLSNATGYEIHWLCIIISSLFVILLTYLLAMVLLRTLKNDVARYLQIDAIDQEEMCCARSTSTALSSSSYNSYRKQEYIGLSMGGSRDTNNFRNCIENNVMPSLKSITYNGLLYEYYFDTINTKHNEEMKRNDESMLFYPTYCYAKHYNYNENEREYYMTVGLNSNIKQNEFKRKALNITIILDRSGSMNCSFYGDYIYGNKMSVANKAVIALLKHLKADDRFCLIVFDDKTETIQKLQFIQDIDLNTLKAHIINIKPGGENEFCVAYNKAISYYDKLFNINNYENEYGTKYENRIIFITDAQINIGCSDPNLLKYVRNDAEKRNKNRIYTTFIGVGLDFYSCLCEEMSSIRGCNYYSVKSSSDFIKTMDQEFDNMVTPLVFNVCLNLKCEGNLCEIEKVYGPNNKKVNDIISNGEILKMNTLFPSKNSKEKGGTKGGIQLIKLKKNNNKNNDINVELEVRYEDRNGDKYINIQNVSFNSPKEKGHNDMIEVNMMESKEMNINFYDNTGIRKAILLCKYVELIKKWIEFEMNGDNNYSTSHLKVNDKYKEIFINFMEYFKKEMNECNDNTLKKEVDIINKLINL